MTDFPNIKIEPKFNFTKTDRVFTIGSCFAREIEAALMGSGITPITVDCKIPVEYYTNEHRGGWNGALNAYTPHSMLDLIKLPDRDDRSRAGALSVGDDKWSDMLLTGLRSLETSELDVAREKLLTTYRQLATADLVVITLGLTESWYDTQDQIWVNKSPALERTAQRQPDRYKFCNVNSAMVMGAMHEIVDVITSKTGGKAKILLTTSPVPLAGTYTARDVIVANMYSKATLLSAAVNIASTYDHVDYYPSYEMVTMGPKADAWEFDLVHVRRGYVEKVVGRFIERYLVKEAI